MPRWSYALAGLVGAGACGGNGPGGDGDGGGGDAPPAATSPADLCTTWTDFQTIHFTCAAAGGDWVEREALATAQGCEPERVGEANLARADDGSVLATYVGRCNNEERLWVERHVAGAWAEASNVPVNTENSQLIAPFTQFGPTLTAFGGGIRVVWTGWDAAYLSRWDGAVWQHERYQTGALVRHPGIIVDGSSLWLHHGSPSPAAFDATDGVPSAMGVIPIGGSEYTLYSSLAIWQGNPVVAYSSAPADLAWPDTTDTIHVAFWNGSSWTVDATGVQDTPGHDGSTPFLFVDGGELFVVYADYTTDGVPTDSQRISFRFRVKRWTGSAWERVGSESEAVWLSQLHEFLHHDGRVYVSVVRGADPEQVVLAWDGSQFLQVGSVLASDLLDGWRARPGNVVNAVP